VGNIPWIRPRRGDDRVRAGLTIGVGAEHFGRFDDNAIDRDPDTDDLCNDTLSVARF
ncbi:hypothetical protein FALBO_10816, partial [Fusarium albosuccineum]